MSNRNCKDCGKELEWWDEGPCAESELWSCDSCKHVVVVPITIERHFDEVDWSLCE